MALAMAGALCLLAAGSAAAVEVEGRLDQRAMTLGETIGYTVIVRGGSPEEPELEFPPGIEVLGTSRSESFSWVNGRSSREVTYRYELAPSRTGRFDVGSGEVRVGRERYKIRPVTLDVLEASQRSGGGLADNTSDPASLIVSVQPAEPWVGEPTVMRVQLVQRAALVEDPRYAPPSTPGFWAERASEPESFYANDRGDRVLVTETRTRLYPLASGETRIGPAAAAIVVQSGVRRTDPLGWLSGGGSRRSFSIESVPVRVRVRPLPQPAPSAYTGAVGKLEWSWSSDRHDVEEDQPLSVTLDVRGTGNLPLVRAPEWSPEGFEKFASTVEDSFAGPGRLEPGRRRFRWTVLPRRVGSYALEPPPIAWFDPAKGSYREGRLPAIAVEVVPGSGASRGAAEAFPRELADHPARPAGRGPSPWAFGLAGLLIGGAWELFRRRAPVSDDDRQRKELKRGLAAPDRGAFDQAAERTARWLAARGRETSAVIARIEASRYGGEPLDRARVRKALEEELARIPSSGSSRARDRALAAGLVVLAVATMLIFGPRGESSVLAARARAADVSARAGELSRARAEWLRLWREGGGDPRLAARLAWADLSAGSTGRATAWVLLGERIPGRDAALAWAAGRVREAGGLVGAGMAMPIGATTMSLVCLVIGFTVLGAGRRRSLQVGLAVVLVVAAGALPAWRYARELKPEAVSLATSAVEGSDLRLEEGQVVRVVERGGRRTRVAIGPGLVGWVPAEGLLEVRQ